MQKVWQYRETSVQPSNYTSRNSYILIIIIVIIIIAVIVVVVVIDNGVIITSITTDSEPHHLLSLYSTRTAYLSASAI